MNTAQPSIIKKYLTKNKYSRPMFFRDSTDFIIWHSYKGEGFDLWNFFEELKYKKSHLKLELSPKHSLGGSSHFIICSDGLIIQCMPLEEISCFSGKYDSRCINVVFCTNNDDESFTDAQYKSMLELGTYLCNKYHIDSRKDNMRYKDLGGKYTPKYMCDNPSIWNDFKREQHLNIKKMRRGVLNDSI